MAFLNIFFYFHFLYIIGSGCVNYGTDNVIIGNSAKGGTNGSQANYSVGIGSTSYISLGASYAIAIGYIDTARNREISIGTKGLFNGLADTSFIFCNTNHAIAWVDTLVGKTGSTSSDSIASYIPIIRSAHRINGTINVTAITGSTLNVYVSYYDEGGVYRVATLPVTNLAGVESTSIATTGTYFIKQSTIWANPLKINMYITAIGGTQTYDALGFFEHISNK